MTGKGYGWLRGLNKLKCCRMFSVHCICHHLALAFRDTGDVLKFISDFETTMIKIWSFFLNFSKRLKTYITTAMRLKEFEDVRNRDLLCRR